MTKPTKTTDYKRRLAKGRVQVSWWLETGDVKMIDELGKRWGIGFARDVVRKAIERAHAEFDADALDP